jgi:hypothetical protein
MFSKDRFHPSPAGYARVAAALLPTVSAALDLFGERSAPTEPNLRRGESVGPVAKAAMRAVTQPGTEVAPAEVDGQARGAQGRWAVLLHRIRPAVPLHAPPGLGEPAAPPVDAAGQDAGPVRGATAEPTGDDTLSKDTLSEDTASEETTSEETTSVETASEDSPTRDTVAR